MKIHAVGLRNRIEIIESQIRFLCMDVHAEKLIDEKLVEQALVIMREKGLNAVIEFIDSKLEHDQNTLLIKNNNGDWKSA